MSADNRVNWYRQSDGALVAHVVGGVDTNQASLVAQGEHPGSGARAAVDLFGWGTNTLVQAPATKAQVRVFHPIVGVEQTRVLIDGEGGSDYYVASNTWTNLPTLQNSWTVYSGTGDAKYRKVGKWVECRGELSAGTTAIDTLLWTFPTGLRPPIRTGCAVWGNLDAGRVIYVNANGEVRLGYAVTAGSVINIAGVRFPLT